jgi:hypothetical protein
MYFSNLALLASVFFAAMSLAVPVAINDINDIVDVVSFEQCVLPLPLLIEMD